MPFIESDESESEGEEEEEENGEALLSPPPSLPKYDEVRFHSPLTIHHSHHPQSTNGSPLPTIIPLPN